MGGTGCQDTSHLTGGSGDGNNKPTYTPKIVTSGMVLRELLIFF
jgi:hypothetical protein